MDINFPIMAGAVSTTIFVVSALPMLLKACSSKDLKSYSLTSIILSNVGNLVHSFYVYSLPAGPIWILHTFYLTTTGLMLFWYLRYELWANSKHKIGASLSSATTSRSGILPIGCCSLRMCISKTGLKWPSIRSASGLWTKPVPQRKVGKTRMSFTSAPAVAGTSF